MTHVHPFYGPNRQDSGSNFAQPSRCASSGSCIAHSQFNGVTILSSVSSRKRWVCFWRRLVWAHRAVCWRGSASLVVIPQYKRFRSGHPSRQEPVAETTKHPVDTLVRPFDHIYIMLQYSFTCHMFRNYESLILARSLFFRKKRSPFVHWSISLVLFRAGQLVTSFWSKNTREWAKEMSAAQEKCETRKFQGRKHKEMSNWQEF